MNLTEVILFAARQYERRLAALALARPREVAQMTVRPEYDDEAKRFFQAFDARREAILAGGEDDAIREALQCCKPFSNFWVLWGALGEENTLEELQTIQNDIIALRAVFKAVRWVEDRQLIRRVENDIAKYA